MLETRESDHGVNLDQAAEILAARVLSGELVLKNWDHTVDQWTARLTLLGSAMPELDMPGWSDADRADAIAQICHGAVSYKEIKEANVWRVLREWLSPAQRAALDSYCPERIDLSNGQSAKITYEAGKDPFIAAARLASVRRVGNPGHRQRPRAAAGPHSNTRPETLANDQGSQGLLGRRLRPDEKGSRRPLPAAPVAGQPARVAARAPQDLTSMRP